MTEPTTVRGWKCFDKDLKCRGIQFRVGGEYGVRGKVEMCRNGYHFHENGYQLFNYYQNQKETRVCEVEAEEVQTEGDKSVARILRVIRELSYEEVCRVLGSQDPGAGVYGYGSGYGYGDGSGHGNGNGNGNGNGSGSGDGKYFLRINNNNEVI